MNSVEVLSKLEEIVGKNFASNNQEDLFIYSQDPGASFPRPVDFVVMPESVEEVQQIVRFANEKKIPLVPMGGGMTLSGLVIPIKGGIILDMKRMDKIIEINETSRYALIESGVTSGQIISYLNESYPDLQAPFPDAPPSITIAGNTLIHGSGYLSQKYGDHASMINGLEVVLANGEILKVGSCAVSENWFTRGPIPDLVGLFTSAFGTMGIVTKLSVKLFPKHEFREVVIGLMKNTEYIPQLVTNLTKTDIPEDLMVAVAEKPDFMKGYAVLLVYITGDDEDEMKTKTKMLKRLYRKNKATYMKLPPRYYDIFLEQPQFAAKAADFRKGGGFEYVGSFMPLENIPAAIDRARDISLKYDIVPTQVSRIIGRGHAVMFAASYSFNRADPEDMERARKALHETNEMVLELGGIPWKAELAGQKMILEHMDPNYKKVLKSIRKILDPNGIMNPGNWEVG